MKLALATAIFLIATSASAEMVNGYLRSDGTYVAPYYRTHADHDFYNNYSTYPNINPYTGKTGTRVTPPSSSSYKSHSSISLSTSRSTSGRHK